MSKDDWHCRMVDNGKMCKADHSNFLHDLPASYKLANAFRKGDLGGSVSGEADLEDLADVELENLIFPSVGNFDINHSDCVSTNNNHVLLRRLLVLKIRVDRKDKVDEIAFGLRFFLPSRECG